MTHQNKSRYSLLHHKAINPYTHWRITINPETYWRITINSDTLWRITINPYTHWRITITSITHWRFTINPDTLWRITINPDTLWRFTRTVSLFPKFSVYFYGGVHSPVRIGTGPKKERIGKKLPFTIVWNTLFCNRVTSTHTNIKTS